MRSDLAKSYGQDRLPRYTSYPTAPHFSPAIGEEVYRSRLKSMPVRSRPRSTCMCRSADPCAGPADATPRPPSATIRSRPIRRAPKRTLSPKQSARECRSSCPLRRRYADHHAAETFVDLVGALRYSFFVLPDAEIAVEIDPRTLTEPMVEALGYCGVNRASLGVQGLHPAVSAPIGCRVLNRPQLPSSVCAGWALTGSISTCSTGCRCRRWNLCLDTVAKCVKLRPDRFSVFGYAHIPSFKKTSARLPKTSLPGSTERHLQAETIAEALLDAGYVRIGLDHFALPGDSLAIARQDGRLKRNFQGYTDDFADTLIGLGECIGRMPQGFVHCSDARLSRADRRGPARYRQGIRIHQGRSLPHRYDRADHVRPCGHSPGIPVAWSGPPIRDRRPAAYREPHRRRRRDHDRRPASISDGAEFLVAASRRLSMPILRILRQRTAARCDAPTRDYFAARRSLDRLHVPVAGLRNFCAEYLDATSVLSTCAVPPAT